MKQILQQKSGLVKTVHLKSCAYGLILSPVSVNNILEQGVGQLATHVAQTLADSNLIFQSWDWDRNLAKFFAVKPDKCEVLKGGNLLCLLHILVVHLDNTGCTP